MANRIIAAPSPHIHGAESTRRIMGDVVLALLPALLVSAYVLGWRVLFVTAVSVVACVAFEYLIARCVAQPLATSRQLLQAYSWHSTSPRVFLGGLLLLAHWWLSALAR